MRANRLLLALAAIATAAAAVRLTLQRKPELPPAGGRAAHPSAGGPAKEPPDREAQGPSAEEVNPAGEIPDSFFWGDGRPGIDMDRLRSLAAASYRPIVQYLTAIEAKRGGERSSLLFIRKQDLEEMAALMHDSPESLVQKFLQLGVLVSMN